MKKFKPDRLFWSEKPRKILHVLKLSLLLTVLTTIGVSASSLAQTAKFNMVRSGVSIQSVFDEISSQSDFRFFYNTEFDVNRKVSIDVKEGGIETIMNRLIAGMPNSYSIVDNYVIIKRDDSKVKQTPASITVNGMVIDYDGTPIIGATVHIKGTTRGTVTDKNGLFRIDVPAVGDVVWLVFSFIGKETREVMWVGQQDMRISMRDAETEVPEVVVTGYQVIDRRKSTSAITSIKMDDIRIEGVSSLDKMLEGRIPDMVFMSNSGEVGVAPRLRVRGTSTLIGNREPLWVVDGVVVRDPVPLEADVLNDPDYVNRIGNAIAGINPQDIERIDVLKDASATALYGTRAANGVIVITTKKGHVGDAVISYNASATFRQRPRYSDRKIDLMNSRERIDFSRELMANQYVFPPNMSMVGYEGLIRDLYNGNISEVQFNSELRRLETVNTDWFDLLTDDSFSHSHTVSVSGGSDKTRYYASLGYTRDNDVIKGAFNERYTVASNLDFNPSQNVTVSFGVNGNISMREYAQSSLAPMNYAYNSSRAIPAFTENGQYEYYSKPSGSFNYYNWNILNELDNSYSKQNTDALSLRLNLRWNVTDFLNLNLLGAYSTSNAIIEGYWGEKTWYASDVRQFEYGGTPDSSSAMPYGGELSTEQTRNRSYTLRLQANLNKYFGGSKQHNLFGSAGFEMNSSRYNGYKKTDRGYYADRGKKFARDVSPIDFPTYYQWVAANVATITDNLTNDLGAFLSISYSYNSLFTLNANGRYDGSNKFGNRSNEKLLPNWSVSGSWNISNHEWFHIEWVDFLSLKASYGYQGNMQDGQTPVMLLTSNPIDPYYGEKTASVRSFANPKLRWERTGSFNTGVEISLFNRRVQIEADYYRKRSKDVFMDKPVSSVNGRESYVVNSGVLQNNGYSISLSVTPIRTSEFSWLLSTSYSQVFNSMNTQPGMEVNELNDFLTGNALVKNKAVGTFYSYRYMGLSPVDGGPVFNDWEDRVSELRGLSKYETYTKVLTASGRREPYMSGNINNNLRWRQWRMGITLTYAFGANTRLFRLFDSGTSVSAENNVNRAFKDRWRNPGDELRTNIPSLISSNMDAYGRYSTHYSQDWQYTDPVIATNAWTMYDYSDLRVVSADFLKISNISLTYAFKRSLIQRLGLSSAEVTLSGTDLHTFCSSKLKGQTPTQGGFTEIQLSERPTFTLTLNLSF